MEDSQVRPRALITGIRGFTGRHLAEKMAQEGFEVFGTSARGEFGESRIRKVDLRNESQVKSFVSWVKPSVVAHLAAISFVEHSQVNEVYDVNVVGTRNLLEALSEQRQAPSCVLVASSSSVYGNTDEALLDESSPVSPGNDYGVSKVAMEHVTRIYADVLPVTVVRPFNYTGVGQAVNFFVPKVVQHVKERKSQIKLGNLNVSRDFLDVRTVIWAYSELLKQPGSGQTFNVSSGKLSRLDAILDLAQKIGNHTLDVRTVPEMSRKREVLGAAGDSSKLWAAVGNPPKISLESTLSWMLSSGSGA